VNVDKYAEYAEHPRYGRGPRFTGLDVEPSKLICGHGNKICGTAVKADTSKQRNATVPFPYYYDVEAVCEKCGRPFIFFAEEQKYWYEKLGFYLWATAVCCPSCRKELQSLRRKQRRYEDLIHVSDRTTEENLEMADCSLALIEEGIFDRRQTEQVRAILNRLPNEQRAGSTYNELMARLRQVEK
jgi:uncharacterized protein YbaR (Trm112 family)